MLLTRYVALETGTFLYSSSIWRYQWWKTCPVLSLQFKLSVCSI